jgi:hypothetical protein
MPYGFSELNEKTAGWKTTCAVALKTNGTRQIGIARSIWRIFMVLEVKE